jgi:hypothetical protein
MPNSGSNIAQSPEQNLRIYNLVGNTRDKSFFAFLECVFQLQQLVKKYGGNRFYYKSVANLEPVPEKSQILLFQWGVKPILVGLGTAEDFGENPNSVKISHLTR